MRRMKMLSAAAATLVLWATLGAGLARAQAQATQIIRLNPGWNAVFLEVDPQAADPAALFAGIPVDSVWGWLDRTFSMQFVQDPSKLLKDSAGWRARFFKPAEAYLSNLHALQGNRAYLVSLGGSDPVDWTVTGRPSTRPIEWVPDSFNLTGFHLDPDPAAPMPTVDEFLAPSAPHAGRIVYRLVDDRWTFVDDPAAATLKAGEAYWIWCDGGSDYQGPLRLDLPGRTGLDFSDGLADIKLTIVNRGAAPRSVTILQEPLPDPEVLLFRFPNGAQGKVEWPLLSTLGPLSVPGGDSTAVRLGVKRSDFAADRVEQVLTVRDDRGTRILVPVEAWR